ncbi:MAG TPA: hypothetical protein VMY78_11340 [Solirubrobacteraceae bacterium]|nr:hypothetical protein [Solirubrobacteraceae bacterium]
MDVSADGAEFDEVSAPGAVTGVAGVTAVGATSNTFFFLPR